MRKIRYNIAAGKKIDYKKYAVFSAIVIGLSFILLMVGIGNLWSSDKRVQDQKRQNEADRLRLEELEKSIAENKEKVKRFKEKWRREVEFSNNLVNGKAYSPIKQLDVLEKYLPEGVFIAQVTLDAKNTSRIQIHIAAQSLAGLTEAYKNFSRFKPVISNETESEGFFKAALILRLKK